VPRFFDPLVPTKSTTETLRASGGVNNKQFTVNAANNRLGVPSAQSGTMTYDNAGNLTTDTYTGAGARTYDAENRMTTAWGGNNQSQVYTYNGDGQRVRRKVDNVETWQIYGFDGELLAEYAMNGSVASPQKEYGYRNGQLLITATATSGGWGAPPAFTPPATLVTGLDIKLEHLTELRSAVNQLRSHAGLSAFNFTVDPNPERNVTSVKADHIRQLRTALEQARSQLGLSTGGYAHPTLTENSSWIYATDFQELRDQILSAWNSGTSGADIQWLVADQLGTPRMIFDKTGALANVKRHDYLPFGEELIADQGVRTTTQGYAADSVRQKFTSKDRDNETGLDFFESRYYSSSQGRFPSADSWIGRRGSPQTWNLYSYVQNNPLKFVDPLGHEAELPKKRGKKGDHDDEFLNTPDTPEVVTIEHSESCKCPIKKSTVQTDLNIAGGLLDEGTFWFRPFRRYVEDRIGSLPRVNEDSSSYNRAIWTARIAVILMPGAGEVEDAVVLDEVLTETGLPVVEKAVKSELIHAAERAEGHGFFLIV
jgi:RHS repeat-associated protein